LLVKIKDIIMRILSDLKVRTKVILAGLFGFGILLPVITPSSSVNTFVVFAQTMPMSSSSSLIPTSPPSGNNETLPSIEITSPQDGQRVPVGELTIEGTSSDNAESNCQIYADVNDMTPMQNATASGQGGVNDYSNWTFTYTPEYQVITEGANELTAKISCFDASLTPVSKYNSVNITGLPSPDTFAAPVPIPSTTS
jgi:hypothetical protein